MSNVDGVYLIQHAGGTRLISITGPTYMISYEGAYVAYNSLHFHPLTAVKELAAGVIQLPDVDAG